MQITTCKKPTKSLNPFQRDISDLLFQRTLGMPDHTQLKQHDNTVASLDVQLHATNKQNSSTFPKKMPHYTSYGF